MLPLSPRAARISNGASVRTFNDYVQTTKAAITGLPAEVRDDKVTLAFQHLILKSFATSRTTAYLAAQRNLSVRNCAVIKTLQEEIARYPVPETLTHRELESFATKAIGLLLRPRLDASTKSDQGGEFKSYFEAYYAKKFVDRFGQPVVRPEISTAFPIGVAISDADIATVEVMLLEYIFDQVDPTPVFGDASSIGAIDPATTKFYPNLSRPTFSVVNSAYNYRCIRAEGRGLTVKSLDRVVEVAKALGDRAAALGGLSFNSFGGVGLSLGLFGKVSIGDNQTLSVLAKTAVSRLAMRLSYASSIGLMASAEDNKPDTCDAGADYVFVFQ